MNISQLKNQLQTSVPAELYKIEPGQIVLFTPESGLTQRTTNTMADFFRYLRKLDKNNGISINVVQTENKYLIDTIAGRSPKETGAPYKVFVGTWDTVAGFAADYFGDNVEDIVSKVPSMPTISRISISDKDLPVVVSINPDDCPKKGQHNAPAQFTCPYMNGSDGFGGMQALVAESNIPTISVMRNKIAELLSKCEQYGYDIDVVSLKNAARESMRIAKNLKLKLDFKLPEQKLGHYTSNTLSVCDIYIVGDDTEYKIDLTPVQKALYLTTILNKEFYLADPSFSFIEDLATIFKQIPEHQEKVKEIEDGQIKRTVNVGIMAKSPSISNILGIKKDIRDAIITAIGHGPAVDEFAIEGYRKEAVSIRKATDRHREQIKKYFGL